MACVATAPTPASAQSTPLPTENTFDCTAAPISPVSGSKPRIENVPGGSAAPLAANPLGRCAESTSGAIAAMTNASFS